MGLMFLLYLVLALGVFCGFCLSALFGAARD